MWLETFRWVKSQSFLASFEVSTRLCWRLLLMSFFSVRLKIVLTFRSEGVRWGCYEKRFKNLQILNSFHKNCCLFWSTQYVNVNCKYLCKYVFVWDSKKTKNLNIIAYLYQKSNLWEKKLIFVNKIRFVIVSNEQVT